MSRRDFELIAWTLKRYAEDRFGGELPEGLAEAFADALARTNDRFDRGRFLRACEPAAPIARREVA